MNGVINVLKPPAMTSAGVVAFMRKLLGERRVGHTGTLDPGAAGVLPVCIGRATKIADYIMRGDKEYITEIAFGKKTDTQDSYGAVLDHDDKAVSIEKLKDVLPRFTGMLMQKPPMYSAIKQGGVKLYQLAREGKELDRPLREVHVYGIEVLGGADNKFLLRVACSKGTYIRTLCEDIGAALDTFAHMSFLLRTKTGGYETDGAYTLDEIEKMHGAGDFSFIRGMEDALLFMEKLTLKSYLYPVIISGGKIDLEKAGITLLENTDYAVYCKNELIGIGKKEGGFLKIAAMLKI